MPVAQRRLALAPPKDVSRAHKRKLARQPSNDRQDHLVNLGVRHHRPFDHMRRLSLRGAPWLTTHPRDWAIVEGRAREAVPERGSLRVAE
jgi:hypothetical protein